MTTPKKIHFLWLNFNNNSDGVLNSQLLFFVNRIKELHPTYNINFINKWKECMDSLDDDFDWIKRLIQNPNLGAAHKSDILRFYYLYKIGGVWVDISTFFVVPIDDLVEQNKDGFTCFYVPHNVCQTWIYKPLATLYDLLPVDNLAGLSQFVHCDMNDKYSNFTFIPESYFCISNKNNPICNTILEMYKEFHNDADMTSKQSFINSRNRYIHKLCCDIFDNNTGILKPIIEQSKNIWKTEPSHSEFLNNIYDSGYLFIYLMMFVAIAEYSLTHEMTPKKLNNDKRVRVLGGVPDDIQGICNSNACYNITLSNKDAFSNPKIHLLSGSYNRLSKWNNKLEQRLSWNDTLAGDIIEKATDKDDLIRKLMEIDITQLKFGAWTRDSSIIPKLMHLFPQTSTEKIRGIKINKKHKTKHKSNLTKQRRSKKYSKIKI